MNFIMTHGSPKSRYDPCVQARRWRWGWWQSWQRPILDVWEHLSDLVGCLRPNRVSPRNHNTYVVSEIQAKALNNQSPIWMELRSYQRDIAMPNELSRYSGLYAKHQWVFVDGTIMKYAYECDPLNSRSRFRVRSGKYHCTGVFSDSSVLVWAT